MINGGRIALARWGVLLTGLLVIISAPAGAHPHVWTDYRVQAQMDAGLITRLHFEFELDSMYSVVVRSEVIMNDTERSMTENTIKQSGVDVFSQSPVILYLTVDGQAQAPQAIALNDAQRTPDGQGYSADVQLAKPGRTISFTVYDPTYYISVGLMDAADAIMMTGGQCTRQRVTVNETVWGPLRTDRIDCALK